MTDQEENAAREAFHLELYIKKLSDPGLTKALLEAAKLALISLGEVHHICANEYIRKDGLVLWTDHGKNHTASVLANCDRLLDMVETSPYERFLVYAAALLHDVGMFARLVEADVETQRLYHGRLAEIVLSNYLEAENGAVAAFESFDPWYVATIARLHQTHELRAFVKNHHSKLRDKPWPFDTVAARAPRAVLDRATLAKLGSILLLADGMDIVKGRADNEIYKAFARVIGQVNPRSSAEWLVNSLVLKYETFVISPNLIKLEYSINLPIARKWLALDIGDNGDVGKVTCEYVLSFLWRYLHDEHFLEFRKRHENVQLEVVVYGEPRRDTEASMSTERRPPTPKKFKLQEWRFWYDGLTHLNWGSDITNALRSAAQLLGCDTAFVMVKDELRKVLRIVVPKDYDTVYEDYVDALYKGKDAGKEMFERFMYDCLSARVPDKFSVAGQVWYRRLPEVVSYRSIRTGRMIADQIDNALRLSGLFYCPVFEDSDDKILAFLLVFNNLDKITKPYAPKLRKHCRLSWTNYIDGTGRPILQDQQGQAVELLSKMLIRRLRIARPTVADV